MALKTASSALACSPQLLGRTLFALGLAAFSLHAQAETRPKFRRIPTQFIAALGDPTASQGTGAEAWGLWSLDPGPRGVELENFGALTAARGVAPARWVLNNQDWWLEEHGLIMESPDFPLPAGKYMVTGDRKVTAVLTVHPADPDGTRRWQLDDGPKLEDVTHLPCRSARYTPLAPNSVCSPAQVNQSAFPVSPGRAMPAVEGCKKQDYAVLFVIAVAVED